MLFRSLDRRDLLGGRPRAGVREVGIYEVADGRARPGDAGRREGEAAASIRREEDEQGAQSRRAVFPFAVDARNPYAYVPTSRDVERMADWLTDLAAAHPLLASQPLAVVGDAYWPLPWYLRRFSQVGYHATLPADAATRPVILLVSSGAAAETAPLAASHVFFPRGLRHEVLVTVAIRRDLWETIESERRP